MEITPSFLDQQEGRTVAFLDFAETLGRPLLVSEARAFRFLLIEWEAVAVKAALKRLPKAKMLYYTRLMEQLRELIVPYPVKVVRLKREKPEAVAEMNEGNFSLVAPAGKGIAVRRLNAVEATERVAQLAKLAGGIAVIVAELALVRNRDRPAASRVVKLARLIAKLSKAFGVRCAAAPGIPAAKSLDEVMEEMRILSRLMEPPQ